MRCDSLGPVIGSELASVVSRARVTFMLLGSGCAQEPSNGEGSARSVEAAKAQGTLGLRLALGLMDRGRGMAG